MAYRVIQRKWAHLFLYNAVGNTVNNTGVPCMHSLNEKILLLWNAYQLNEYSVVDVQFVLNSF